MLIGDKLRGARKSTGLSQQKLGQLANVSSSYISDLETGVCKNPSYDILYRLSMALGIETTDLQKDIILNCAICGRSLNSGQKVVVIASTRMHKALGDTPAVAMDNAEKTIVIHTKCWNHNKIETACPHCKNMNGAVCPQCNGTGWIKKKTKELIDDKRTLVEEYEHEQQQMFLDE